VTEGERWTEQLLAELRAAGYRPRAWGRLLSDSRTRAAVTRARRQREHRQALALAAAGLLAWGTVMLAGHPLAAVAGASWWLLLALMLDWHLGMLESADGDRVEGLGIANVICVGRAGLAPALVIASPPILAGLLVAAGISDAVDGPIARARRQQTRLGHWLDGSADGLVLGAAAIGAAHAQLLPWWATALVLGRHGLQWLVIAAAYFARAQAPPRHGFVSGRLPGLVLFAGLLLALLQVPGAAALVAAGAVGALATLGLTIVRSQRLHPT